MPGFAYNLKVKAPLGTEWQNPTQVALNKERPHAWFFSFANEQEALKVLPEASLAKEKNQACGRSLLSAT